eukprot:2430651-Rhodomonas_salina.1
MPPSLLPLPSSPLPLSPNARRKLASNALSTIKAIDEDMFAKLMKKFTFTGTRTNGIKDGIRTQ